MAPAGEDVSRPCSWYRLGPEILFVAWRVRPIFFAPAGLPALLLVSRQSLWEWSGERLPFSGCWRCMEWAVFSLSSLAYVVICSWHPWKEWCIEQTAEGELPCGKEVSLHMGCSHSSLLHSQVSVLRRTRMTICIRWSSLCCHSSLAILFLPLL
jgi:hypothetical protein